MITTTNNLGLNRMRKMKMKNRLYIGTSVLIAFVFCSVSAVAQQVPDAIINNDGIGLGRNCFWFGQFHNLV